MSFHLLYLILCVNNIGGGTLGVGKFEQGYWTLPFGALPCKTPHHGDQQLSSRLGMAWVQLGSFN